MYQLINTPQIFLPVCDSRSTGNSIQQGFLFSQSTPHPQHHQTMYITTILPKTLPFNYSLSKSHVTGGHSYQFFSEFLRTIHNLNFCIWYKQSYTEFMVLPHTVLKYIYSKCIVLLSYFNFLQLKVFPTVIYVPSSSSLYLYQPSTLTRY